MLRTHRDNNIVATLHDVDVLREKFPEWDSYTKKQKLFAARRVAPEEQHFEHNVACVGQFTLISRLMDPEDGLKKSDIEYRVAVGDGVETGVNDPLSTNEALYNQLDEFELTDSLNQGGETLYSVFIDSGELNNQEPNELGVFAVLDTGTRYLLNHSAIGEFRKLSNKTATLDQFLAWTAQE